MAQKIVELSAPADPTFARSVRMMAANLAVLCKMNVDELEDVKMAAEEGFVFACGTQKDSVDITFTLEDNTMAIDFDLGDEDPVESEVDNSQPLELVELLLSAICDEFALCDDGYTLHLVKISGGAHA
ncbi:MAG: ATP-binding protein [Atopobium sp.]|nr:ATP-binding protein [Atopobium sp.]MBS4870467.1 ATP-binding protein [Atopobium sp.]